ncbi:VirB4-like conjugal transfer ATPase, CD1110 family [Butyrivibrio sp. INlla16]|uniref:VirB4-like conjugal transfer ATPase, CD1110 family n=1 Tax=Butyrivibrio sp. INlla16 TaxID=1520807 RepID=UPI001FA7E1BF
MPRTAQDTVPYRKMFEDGICQVTRNYYTKTVRFEDTNYEMVSDGVKKSIFDGLCDFYNYFDPSATVQMSYVNQQSTFADTMKAIEVDDQDDQFNDIRDEYRQMLRKQLTKGNNGLEKFKYVTFGIESDNIRTARIKLNRMETGIMQNLRLMGVESHSLDGKERLKVMHGIMNPGTDGRPFTFSYDNIRESGGSTKDYIVPMRFDFSENDSFRMDKTWCSVSVIDITCAEMLDDFMSKFLHLDRNLIFTMFVHPVNQKEAIKSIKGSLSDIQKKKIDEQKKAVRAGYDMDLIPSDINTYGESAQSTLNDLMRQNEKMFRLTLIVMNFEDSKDKLDSSIEATNGVIQLGNCTMRRLEDMQEQGFVSSLPLGLNLTEEYRQLPTVNTAILIPFTTRELFIKGSSSLYYGLNSISNNMILADRKRLINPNGLILGVPGAGKSFSAKREILGVFLQTDDDIVVTDPEGEYYPLINALDGQVIHISSSSNDYINPMDVNLDVVRNPEKYKTGDADTEEDIGTIVKDKSAFIMSFCEIIMNKPGGMELDGGERNFIDRCVKQIYEKFLYNNPTEETMPTLEDLYNVMMQESEHNEKGRNIAECLEMYVHGSQNIFNHRTNINLNNRTVCFDIKKLNTTLRKLGMFIIQNMVWTRVSQNRNAKRFTRYYIDEFHLLLNQPQTASYSLEIWKRFRKWGGIPTGITQNISDLLSSPQTKNIFNNSPFIYLLKQSEQDVELLAEYIGLSDTEKDYLVAADMGCGIVKFGDTIISFADHYPTDTITYKLLTTKPTE